jgi:TIR domain
MSSLAELPELVGFFSYSREDDADSHGALSMLRSRIQGELRGQLGRTAKTFRLWQDKEAIASGTLWEIEIKNAVAQSAFFIPIVTPTVVASPYCRFELESFLAREARGHRVSAAIDPEPTLAPLIPGVVLCLLITDLGFLAGARQQLGKARRGEGAVPFRSEDEERGRLALELP